RVASMERVNIVPVPYKSSWQSMTDMITGRLDMQFATIAPSLPNIRAGQLRALVTSGKTRVAALPELPTGAEAGLAGYEAALWVSFVMPSAAPPTIIARLNREVNEILGSADGKAALVAQGMEGEPGPPAAVSERIRSDIRKWREGAASAGIQAEEHRARSPPFPLPNPRQSPQGKRVGHREQNMRTAILLSAIAFATPAAFANDIPRFQVDPSWPQTLPNNWIMGQAAGVAVDAQDHVWVIQRPKSLTNDEKAAT